MHQRGKRVRRGKSERTLLVTSQIVRRELDVPDRKLLRCCREEASVPLWAIRILPRVLLLVVMRAGRRNKEDEGVKEGQRKDALGCKVG